MKPWFRHYVGMTRDDRLIEAAMRSKQPLDRVVFVWCCILESASECDEGGTYLVAPETIAYQLRAPLPRIRAIFDALTEGGRIANGRIVQWASRQFESDTSRDRMRRHRAAKGSHGDADVTHGDVTVTDQSRAEQSRTEQNRAEKEAAAARAQAGATQICLPASDAELRAWLGPIVGTAPVALDLDMTAVRSLLDEPLISRGDVEAGVRQAIAKSDKPIRSWSSFGGWIRRAAKDRLGAQPRGSPGTNGSGPHRGGPRLVHYAALEIPDPNEAEL